MKIEKLDIDQVKDFNNLIGSILRKCNELYDAVNNLQPREEVETRNNPHTEFNRSLNDEIREESKEECECVDMQESEKYFVCRDCYKVYSKEVKQDPLSEEVLRSVIYDLELAIKYSKKLTFFKGYYYITDHIRDAIKQLRK